jgi:hypothetical protein
MARAVALVLLALVAAACSTGWSYGHQLAAAGLAPADTITVILQPTPTREFSPSLETKVANCIRDALLKSHPTIRVIPGDEVRRRIFGAQAPDRLPSDADSWERLTRDPDFQGRVASLGTRYLISAEVTEWKNWKGWDFLPVTPVTWLLLFYGRWTWRVGSDMNAWVVDLMQARTVGRAVGEAMGESFWGVFIVVPFFKLSFPEGPACRSLGGATASLLTNPNPPQPRPAQFPLVPAPRTPVIQEPPQ